jgi:hypothetical protein
VFAHRSPYHAVQARNVGAYLVPVETIGGIGVRSAAVLYDGVGFGDEGGPRSGIRRDIASRV